MQEQYLTLVIEPTWLMFWGLHFKTQYIFTHGASEVHHKKIVSLQTYFNIEISKTLHFNCCLLSFIDNILTMLWIQKLEKLKYDIIYCLILATLF